MSASQSRLQIVLVFLVLLVTTIAQGGLGADPSFSALRLQPGELSRGNEVDFILSLLSSSSPTLVYIVYDLQAEHLVSSLALQLSTSSTKVVLFHLSSSQEAGEIEIYDLLEENMINEVEKHIVLLNSPESILDLFRKVRQEALESTYLRWYISTQPLEFLDSLEALLREGTWVVMGTRRKQDDDSSSSFQNRIDIYSTRVDINGAVRFERIGYWEPSMPRGRGRIRLWKPIFPDLVEYYNDFKGRHLVTAAVHNPPKSPLKTLPDGRLRNEGGLDGNILSILAKRFNFTFEAVNPPDGVWGGPQPDGTVTGIVGMVARREVDLSINTIATTPQREVVVDFTNPYIFGPTAVVSQAPVEKNRALAILRPFSLEVWLCLLGAVCSAGLVVLIVTTAAHRIVPDSANPRLELGQVLWYSFNLFRSLMIQGNLLQPRRAAPRIVSLAWYFFCLNLYIVYSSILTSFLTLPFFEAPIDSLEDLYSANQERGILLTFPRDSSFEYIFTYAHADSGIYAKLKETLTEDSFAKSTYSALLRLEGGENIAYVGDFLVATMKTNEIGKSKFHVGKQTFFPQPFAVAMPSGCPYVANFNKELLRLQEFGLPEKWFIDGISEAEHHGKNKKHEDDDSRGLLPILSLKHLQSALIVYAAGVFLGLIVLLVEVCFAAFPLTKNH